MNQEKFENLVLAICEQVPPQHLGTVKLNKLIWLIDRNAICQFGETITGVRYIKNFDGPVPYKNHDLFMIMKEKKLLEIEKETVINLEGSARPKYSYAALAKPNWDVFSAQERQRIETDLSENKYKAVGALVNMSHDIVWASVDDKEEIHMEAYLSSSDLDNSPVFQRSIDASERYYLDRM